MLGVKTGGIVFVSPAGQGAKGIGANAAKVIIKGIQNGIYRCQYTYQCSNANHYYQNSKQ